MRYAIIADIHSNFEALEAVLKAIRQNDIDKIICCGDVVGYGPSPKECIDVLIAQKNTVTLMGNHDALVAGVMVDSNINDSARKAININRKQLNNAVIDYLASLPKTYATDNMQFVHGSLRDPLNEYLKTYKAFQNSIDLMQGEVLFCGHTHYPKVYSRDKEGKETMEDLDAVQVIKINNSRKYIVDAGSVGQPRDEDNRSCFVCFDTSNATLKYIRTTYNIQSVQDKMHKLGMPEELTARLASGV